jgi:hypothetical protein
LRRLKASLLAVVLAGAAIPSSPQLKAAGLLPENSFGGANQTSETEPTGDLLQFLDGSSLHGRLHSISPAEGVGWQHPEAKDIIEFKPANIACIRFENPRSVMAQEKPGCRFRFNNGDEVFGNLTAIDENHLQMQTWFGGLLKTPRLAVQSVTFLSKGFSVLYEGPTSASGWVQGRNPKGWEYHDGAFVATSAGTLGHDFHLSGSSSVSFDLGWNGQFSLILALYTPVLDRFDYSSSSYMFYLSPGYVTLQRVQGGAGAVNLGQAPIPEMSQKAKLHMEVRANKADATLGLFVDDRLIQRWKDGSGFVGQGSGIVFFAQLDGPSIKISNLKVAQWEGDFGLDPSTNSPGKEDLVYLVNRDKVTGTLQRLRDNLLTVASGGTRLDIPLSRVSQICLGNPVTNAPAANPWEVRAYFAGGGTVAFEVQKWDDARVLGRSGTFGTVDFNPQFIRQLQFNLGRSKLGTGEMEILDQEVWELE